MTAPPLRQTTSAEPAIRGSRAVEDLADLAVILDPSIHVAIWRRPTIPTIGELLAQPECQFGRHSRLVAHASDPKLRTRIGRLLPDAAHEADPAGMTALLNDANMLCGAFAELLAADELMISYEAPNNASCPRFHVDRVGIRMLVTYRGPGTEILPDEFANREWLGAAGHGLRDEDSGLIGRGAKILTAEPFAVVLLKGEAWPEAKGFGAIHRSPDPGTAARTLLRVDMLSQLPINDANCHS